MTTLLIPLINPKVIKINLIFYVYLLHSYDMHIGYLGITILKYVTSLKCFIDEILTYHLKLRKVTIVIHVKIFANVA